MIDLKKSFAPARKHFDRPKDQVYGFADINDVRRVVCLISIGKKKKKSLVIYLYQ